MKNKRVGNIIPQHIGYTKRGITLSYVVVGVILGIMALAILVTIVALASSKNPSVTVRHQTVADGTTFNQKSDVLGAETVNNGGFEIEMVRASYLDIANGIDLRLAVKISNASTSVIQFSPLLQMSVADGQNVRYPFTATVPGAIPMGGPIEAGSSVSGAVDFVIPKNATVDTLIFKADSETAEQVFNF